jgi:hypothetical protein
VQKRRLFHRKSYDEGWHANGRTPNEVFGNPEIDVDGIEDPKQRESPRDSIDNDLLSCRKELVDDGTQKKEMDQGPGRCNVLKGRKNARLDQCTPDEEGPGSRGNVRLFASPIDLRRTGDGEDISAEEEEVNDDVDYLSNTVMK